MNENDKEIIGSILTNQRRARDEKKYELARKLADQGEEFLITFSEKEAFQFWSQLYYERGFMLNIAGDFEGAIKYFKLSGEVAKKYGDQIRGAIGEFRAALTGYLCGKILPKNAYKTLKEVYSYQSEITQIPYGEDGLLEGSKFNTLKRLVETTFEVSQNEYESISDRIMEHEYFISSRDEHDPMYELLRWQIKARTAIINGNYNRALSIFSTMLNIDIEGTNIDGELAAIKPILETGLKNAEEVSREYRDFGRAIMKSDIENKEKWAAKVWHQGLEIPKGRGNLIFLRDIQNDLGTLT